jgi:hypothetical protein
MVGSFLVLLEFLGELLDHEDQGLFVDVLVADHEARQHFVGATPQ